MNANLYVADVYYFASGRFNNDLSGKCFELAYTAADAILQIETRARGGTIDARASVMSIRPATPEELREFAERGRHA